MVGGSWRRACLVGLLGVLVGCSSGRPEVAHLDWPVEGGRFSSPYGRRGWKFHDGIDISAPAGTPVRSVLDGIVIFSGVRRGYGNVVVVRHAKGFWTLYGHNQRNFVHRGDRVAQGECIATVGTSGNATGPNLHFEVRRDGEPVDPTEYLTPEVLVGLRR